VLPAALWGEKTGTYTNADRTVHLSEQAVEPPGDARSDLEMFVEYAQRMGFTDRDGNPHLSFSMPEEAFEEFKQVSAGRPCDYSGLSYEKLRGSAGIQWPCNGEFPDGCERLYVNHEFPTHPEYCESYGHDLISGAENEPDEYRAHDPAGRAFLKAAEYVPSPEQPSDDYPFLLNTGRTVYHSYGVRLVNWQGRIARGCGLGSAGGAHRLSSTFVSRLICAGWCRMTVCAR
jgi:anaerobic selenocysteine-containing dehydrogenase